MAASSAVERSLEKIRKMIESGSHYEAQQMLKTFYHRSKAKKQVQDSYTLLAEGAVMQLQHGHVTCGVELGLMLVEAFTLDKAPKEEAQAALIAILSSLKPPATSSSGTEAAASSSSGPLSQQDDAALDEETRLVTAAVKWAHKRGSPEAARQMHDVFALRIWEAHGWRRMGRAGQHFVRGSDASQFAKALYCCARLAPAAEADLFPCRAVLQTLAASTKASLQRQLSYASDVLEACLLMGRGTELEASPLMHFCQLLIEALGRRSKALTALLRQRYSESLLRDEAVFAAYLTQIERVFLGVGVGSGGFGGLLGGLLKSLTTMEEEEEEEEEERDNVDERSS